MNRKTQGSSSGPRPRALLVGAAALVFSAALAAGALAASTNFVEPATSPEQTGTEPRSVAAADLDGDTDQDLAVANQGSDNVTILRNTGSGNFVEAASSPETTGDFPISVIAADLDGDTDQDLAVANRGQGNVTILRNTGSGSFNETVWSPEPAGDTPAAIAAADLDGDTDQDLAVANSASNDVTILRNTGSGNFVEPVWSPEPATGGPVAIAAADLDGDTDRDLAVLNQVAANITILRNRGAGNFVQPASSPEGTGGGGPSSLAAADLDGDTDQDLAVANQDSDNVAILRNTGAGNFVEAASSPEGTGMDPGSVATADFDGDTDQDLAVANQAGGVTILRNTGSGNFVQPVSSPEAAGETPASVAVADLDGDADGDLAVANLNSFDVTILRNRNR